MSTASEYLKRLNRYKTLRVKSCQSVSGLVRVSGAKNSALPLLAASLLTEGLTLKNFPILLDTLYAVEILSLLGKEVSLTEGVVSIRGGVKTYAVPSYLSALFRGSVLFLGGLLGAIGRAKVAHPGGCPIGKRPIDQHLKFLESVGCTFSFDGGYIYVRLPRGVKSRRFRFDVITVTGTENALLTLAGLKGEFVLENCALEPEVLDLVEFLKKLGMGIEIEGRTFKVFNPSPESLRGKRISHRIIPDRIEAGTFLVLGALLGEPLRVENVNPNHLGSILSLLKRAGAKLKVDKNSIKVERAERIKPLKVRTEPYPGFPTDMQAQFMAMLSLADGTSEIEETIFENRFRHAAELSRMGADIEVKGRVATVRGVRALKGARVNATDLRASAALVLAGLVAEGETLIGNVGQLLRGYEKMEEKLKGLGCEVYLLEKDLKDMSP